MEVIGIGVDLVDVERFKAALARWDRRFVDRLFTSGEQAYCDATAQPWIHYAARFAAKEAVSKAFATGIGARLRWLDIDVVRDPVSGAPSVRLTGGGRALAAERGARRVWISLSHTDRQAIAQAMVTGGGGEGAAT